MRISIKSLVALATAGAVLSPAAAQAAGKSVFAGPPRPIDGIPEFVHPAHFFPKKIKVRKGQSIDFHFRGFHTVTFLGDADRPPFFETDGQKVSGQNDAAGNPFWFNGQDRRIVNPAVFLPAGDGKVDNDAVENSGLPPEGDEPPPAYTLKFPQAGTFKYLCQIHPRMTGRVKVLPKGRRVPSASRDEVRIAKQVRRITRAAKRRGGWDGPDAAATVRAGHDTKDLEVLKFFPSEITVKAGQTVRWFQSHIHEFHTVVFGPRDYLRPIGQSFIAPDESAPQGGPPTLAVNPLAYFSSDPPGGVPAYDATNHGNGFLNSGVMSTDPIVGLPREFRATFTKPGTYEYFCFVHGPIMRGTVTVVS